ncbi:hypothetical protein [Aliagarivorans taiwanensis]|uniref:hypothetical protein n=1 Tax=Aliagarivorans taiwanensis TaxID=561966 RepID=UPI0003FEC35E|nr:hypothetical protein [Aliagarivorans taiwanensis]
MSNVHVKASPVYHYADQAGDYPMGVFEMLASKEAELELLKQRTSQLESDIARLKSSCRRDLNCA